LTRNLPVFFQGIPRQARDDSLFSTPLVRVKRGMTVSFFNHRIFKVAIASAAKTIPINQNRTTIFDSGIAASGF
jgi:hypothetical protein